MSDVDAFIQRWSLAEPRGTDPSAHIDATMVRASWRSTWHGA